MLMGIFGIGRHVLSARRTTTAAAIPRTPPARERSRVSIPVCGLGGITTAEDAVEFLLAGASAVQIGTASYADPRAVQRIAESLERWCERHRVGKVRDLIGGVQPN